MTKFGKIAAIALLCLGVLLAVMALVTKQPSAANQGLAGGVASGLSAGVAVVVAARDLPAGHVLQAADLQMQKLTQLPNQGFSVPQPLLGRTTAVEILRDQPIVSVNLLDGLAGMLAPGERAVSIKVDEANAVGHKLQPGDWVDVFAVLRRDNQEVQSTQARMLLPRKKVLAYGAQMPVLLQDKQAQEEALSNDKDGEKLQRTRQDARAEVPARTAVIVVQVEEVGRLLLAEQMGQVLLALRSPADKAEPSIQVPDPGHEASHIEATAALDASLTAVTMAELGHIGTARSVQPLARVKSAVEPPGRTVEVIRGTRKEKIKY